MARILITGSNSGFGQLAALTLARQGHDVVATMRTVSKGDDLRATASDENLPIEIRALDVRDDASVHEAVGDPAEIDAIVNNAGFELVGAIELVDDELVVQQFDTNVRGPLRLIRAVLPAWRRRGSGTIVNISSIAGMVGAPFAGLYAASKHSLEALSEALHFEVAVHGIRVRVVVPGSFDTGFQGRSVAPPGWEMSDYAERSAQLAKRLGALSGDDGPGDPQAVADAITRAILDDDAPFRQYVGADSQLIHSAKSSMPFEDFEAAMRATIDWYD